RGLWGGAPERDGLRISARISPREDASKRYEIELEVRSTNPARPLEGSVAFHLHPAFMNQARVTTARSGVARLHLLSSGAFTIGAEVERADGRHTRLELDLSTVEGAPEEFR